MLNIPQQLLQKLLASASQVSYGCKFKFIFAEVVNVTTSTSIIIITMHTQFSVTQINGKVTLSMYTHMHRFPRPVLWLFHCNSLH